MVVLLKDSRCEIWPVRAGRSRAALRSCRGSLVAMDVGARGERALAGSGEDDGARIVIDLDRNKRGHQAVDQVVAERVEPVRPVQRDRSVPSSISRRMASDILSLQAYWRSLSPLRWRLRCVYLLVGIHRGHTKTLKPDPRAHYFGGKFAVL